MHKFQIVTFALPSERAIPNPSGYHSIPSERAIHSLSESAIRPVRERVGSRAIQSLPSIILCFLEFVHLSEFNDSATINFTHLLRYYSST